jgi:hypothetical protein
VSGSGEHLTGRSRPGALPPERTALLACDVFKEEVETLLPADRRPAKIRFLEMGLHDRPDDLRRAIEREIAALEEDEGVDTILLLYALCGNGLVGVRARRRRLVLPRAHDCVGILLGGPERHREVLRDHPATYFYSPGWIRGKRVPGPDREAYLRAEYAERFGDDEEIIDELVEADAEIFGHHDRAAYVDFTGNEEARRYCRDCALHLGWRFEELRADPGQFLDLFAGDWDPARFLVVEPGEKIGLAGDERIVRAEKEENGSR